MKYKKYPQYKDSGVEWLGKVPTEWLVMQFRRITNLQQGLQIPQENRFTEGNEETIEYITIKSLNAGSNREHKEYIRKPSTRVQCTKDDVLLARTGATGEVVTNIKGVFHNNFFKVNYDKTKISKLYLVYLLKTKELKSHLLMLAGTTTIPDLNHGAFLSTGIPLPFFQEQQTIANYLDKTTAKIDTLIEKQTKLIELLKEKRQAVISTTVTRGLDSSVPMKDSGVEWLGEIPEQWEVKKLKHIGEAIIGLTYSPTNIVDENEGTLVLRSSNLQNGGLYYGDNVYVNSAIPDKLIVKSGDIVICSRNGSRKLIGKNAMIDKQSAGVSFGAFTSVFRSKQNPFVFYILNSSLFKYQSGRFMTTTINQLTTGTLNEFKIAFPSASEQLEIVNYLADKTSKIDTLISKATKAIELLKERRAALISAVVTGKIDVREE